MDGKLDLILKPSNDSANEELFSLFREAFLEWIGAGLL